DLCDLDRVASCVAGADAVSHQAAMVGLGVDFGDAPAYVHNNDLATAVLLRALAASGFGGRLVLAGSMVVYGEGGYRWPTHGPVRPGPRSPDRLRDGWFEPECPSCGRDIRPEPVVADATADRRCVDYRTYAREP